MNNSNLTDEACDERIIEISSRMYDLSMLLSRFMIEMLETAEDYSIPVEMEVPVYDNDVIKIIRIDTVYFDRDSGEIMLCNREDNKTVLWKCLDVAAMDYIVNYANIKRKTEVCHRSLKQGSNPLN